MLQERLAGAVAPRYVLERELAGGGMARVFLARDPLLDRQVVIKVLPPERATAVGMERFHREARLLAKLNHPHIIPILDTGASRELPWFVMPWIAGETLTQRIAAGKLDAVEVRRIGRELLDALAHAHRLGVVHRDIKPANIFLHAGHALLADFGVADLTSASDDTLTDAGLVVGTAAYMAPEHREGGFSDPRTDLWELAATLYEAHTGERWTARSGGADAWGTVHPSLRRPLERALAERAADRWPDASTFGKALRRSSRAIAARRWYAGAIATSALLVTWPIVSGRNPQARAKAGAAPVVFQADSGAADWIAEVARNATTTMQWLPRVGNSAIADGAPAMPIRIAMREIAGTDSLVMVGVDANNVLVLRERVGSAAQDWSREVVDRMIAQLFPSRLLDFRLLVHSTGNVRALNAWYHGSEAFQSGQWDAAERHYREALRHDTAFVAASWSLLLTDMWRREPHHEALADLTRRRDQLPPVVRELIDAQVEPHLPTRLARFDSLAAVYPDFWPARMLQANELFHRGPLVGRSLQEGVAAFMAAAREVPDLDHRTTWQHVLWGAIKLGDESTARAAWRRIRTLPGDVELSAFLALALDARFSRHGPTARRGLLHLAATGPRLETMSQYLRLGNTFDIPDEVRRMSHLIADRTDEPDGAAALATLATTLLMSGRVHEALDALDRAAERSASPIPYRVQAAEWRVLLPFAGIPVDSTERDAGLAALRVLAGDREWWPRAVWALALADPAAGESWSDSLRLGSAHHALARHLGPLLEAQRLADAQGPAAALEGSGSIHVDPGDSMVIARGPLARAVTYLQRGRWWLQLGDSAAADREWTWYENNDLQGWPSGPPQDGELDAALSVPARLMRAALLCASGQHGPGRTLLHRARTLWASADPEVGARGPLQREAVTACQ